jgi:hypothetical protein
MVGYGLYSDQVELWIAAGRGGLDQGRNKNASDAWWQTLALRERLAWKDSA